MDFRHFFGKQIGVVTDGRRFHLIIHDLPGVFGIDFEDADGRDGLCFQSLPDLVLDGTHHRCNLLSQLKHLLEIDPLFQELRPEFDQQSHQRRYTVIYITLEKITEILKRIFYFSAFVELANVNVRHKTFHGVELYFLRQGKRECFGLGDQLHDSELARTQSRIEVEQSDPELNIFIQDFQIALK